MTGLADAVYLLIWVLGIVAWFVARQRNEKRPYLWLLVAFLTAGAFELVRRNV